MAEGRYRVEWVSASGCDGGASGLQRLLDTVGPSEQVKSIVPFAQTGGWTTKYLVVIELLSSS